MEIHAFITKYGPYAKSTQESHSIPAVVTLAQAAAESAWGEKQAGKNNLFGIKDFDGINGNEELVTTFEFNKNGNLTPKQIGLVNISSIVPSVTYPGFFRYTGQAYFRKYETPKEAFDDHAAIFFRVGGYHDAIAHIHEPELFAQKLAPIYAQSPGYAPLLLAIMHNLEAIDPSLKVA